MFTGIITAIGTVKNLSTRGNYRVLDIMPSEPWRDIALGESIAIDGACLTVTAAREGQFQVEASQETTARTIVRQYGLGSRVSLERALQVGERLGGHLVTGHVDTRGKVGPVRRIGESWELSVRYAPEFDPLVVAKGSIAVNGVSLTVNEVELGNCRVNVIPFTWEYTALSTLRSNTEVNLEFDLIGKYILRQQANASRSQVSMEQFRTSGW